MLALFKSTLLTLFLGIVGVCLALPISYFFQDDLYTDISFYEYVAGGRQSVAVGAEFGSVTVYKYTLYACILGCIVLGRFIQWRISQRKK